VFKSRGSIKSKSPKIATNDALMIDSDSISETVQQMEANHTPDIPHEMSELFRTYSSPRTSHLNRSSLRVTTKDLQPGQNPISLPAPARFTRKNKQLPKNVNDGSSLRKQSTQNESPCPSTQNSLSIPLDDPYVDLLQKLMMDWYEFPSDASSNLDTQLNEPS
jgi:hypothetical protein